MTRLFHRAALALLLAFGSGGAHAGTSDYADFWWVPSESGWGLNLSQQNDVIFATLFVYDAGHQPVWLSFAALQTGPGAFAGDLYRSTGPAYSLPFDPNAVTRTKVGTSTLTFTDSTTATLSYTIDGVPVTKTVTRTAYRDLPVAGSYIDITPADYHITSFGCAVEPHFPDSAPGTPDFVISTTGGSMQLLWNGPNCTLQGPWTQSGTTIQASLASTTSCLGTSLAFALRDLRMPNNDVIHSFWRLELGAPYYCTGEAELAMRRVPPQ